MADSSSVTRDRSITNGVGLSQHHGITVEIGMAESPIFPLVPPPPPSTRAFSEGFDTGFS